jgi:hypothetical protein
MGALAVSGGPATAVAKTRTKLASVAIVDRSPSASATLLRSVSLRLVMVGLANGIEWQLAPGPGQPSHDPPSKPCPARRLEAASYFSAVPQDQNLQQWPPAGQRCAPERGHSHCDLCQAGEKFSGGVERRRRRDRAGAGPMTFARCRAVIGENSPGLMSNNAVAGD